MYAIADTSYRAVTADMPLNPGESRVLELPASLLSRMKGDQMKAERSQRLRATDWTQMADAPLTSGQKLLLATYRQALRDLPSLPGFPEVAWPAPPTLQNDAADIQRQPGDLIP